MKKSWHKFLLLSIFALLFLLAGCSKKSAVLSNSNKPAASIDNTNASMKEISNTIDKLDNTLNSLNDSREINNAESLVNNIK